MSPPKRTRSNLLPSTVVRKHCVCGSVDGSVYCVRARDGALRWRFRISQDERRTLVDDSLESVWPIHGSVLVLQDTVYFAAGRSSHLDGGIRLFALDLANGTLAASFSSIPISAKRS